MVYLGSLDVSVSLVFRVGHGRERFFLLLSIVAVAMVVVVAS